MQTLTVKVLMKWFIRQLCDQTGATSAAQISVKSCLGKNIFNFEKKKEIEEQSTHAKMSAMP